MTLASGPAPHPGGMLACSRWLGGATPPVADSKQPCIPAGMPAKDVHAMAPRNNGRRLSPDVDRHAAASTISGCVPAILSRTWAAPLGLRVPCSQWCSVRRLIPSRSANLACERPSLCRVAETAICQSACWRFWNVLGETGRRTRAPCPSVTTAHTRAGAASPRSIRCLAAIISGRRRGFMVSPWF